MESVDKAQIKRTLIHDSLHSQNGAPARETRVLHTAHITLLLLLLYY